MLQFSYCNFYLKEMLRFSDHDKVCEAHLQEALDCMLEVVRYVNDSMHQVSIQGFPVSSAKSSVT